MTEQGNISSRDGAGRGGRVIALRKALHTEVVGAQAERPRQALSPEERRLACMRAHPSNGTRKVREMRA